MNFELLEAPWLVRQIIEAPSLPRPLRSLPKIAFNNIHMLCRWRAPGLLRVRGGTTAFTAKVDLRNRQFIDTVRAFHAGGCYEPEVSAVFDMLVKGTSTVYDVGANFGYFSLRAALNPAFAGTVHAFEMSPRTFADLNGMVTSAQLGARIVPHNVGLSDTTGTLPFWEDQHSGRSKVSQSIRSTKRPVARLDDYDLPPPDVIKIDVEGHEGAVLAGAVKSIAAGHPAILFESWRGSADEKRPFAILAAIGYRFFVPLIDGGRIYLHQATGGDQASAPSQRNILAVTERHACVLGECLPAQFSKFTH